MARNRRNRERVLVAVVVGGAFMLAVYWFKTRQMVFTGPYLGTIYPPPPTSNYSPQAGSLQGSTLMSASPASARQG